MPSLAALGAAPLSGGYSLTVEASDLAAAGSGAAAWVAAAFNESVLAATGSGTAAFTSGAIWDADLQSDGVGTAAFAADATLGPSAIRRALTVSLS